MDDLHRRISAAVADENLQAALDANAERRVRGRLNAYASLPDWRERRSRAHAVRAEVIERLPDYLEQFTARARANGITVHRAASASEAAEIVLEITRRRYGTEPVLFAKSKSMLTEEIGLNPALEKAGHRVVETDLGEYIVQLRGERPAHLLTPAVHLRRQQVGRLFEEKLGIPYTEDIPTLTEASRLALRQVFLEAQIGLTGVNFGIVENGALVTVSNEGNARMCAGLPPVHIALMGMERLLPGMQDLALMLSLLPRAATGQKANVYTQIIRAPENGQEKHLVIVDNGRSLLRTSSLKEALYCIRCGSCLNACPVFREIGGHAYLGADGTPAPYPGPIGVVLSAGLLGENFAPLAQASSLCGACKDACPVDIDLPRMLLRIRAGELPGHEAQEGQGLPAALGSGLRLDSHAAAAPGLFAFAQRLAGFAGRFTPGWIRLPAATGWGASRDLPAPAARPFRDQFAELPVLSPHEALTQPVPPITPAASPFPAPDFAAELAAAGGQLHRVRPEEVTEALIDFLQERGIRRVQAWKDIPFVRTEVLRAAGVELVAEPEAGIPAGLTGALAGIAATGTLLIPGGPDRPLTASLLPRLHIAVLGADWLTDTMEAAFALPGAADAPASVLITGPSRTADIEMSLTIGMHGPGELHVFLVDAHARE